ncbi:hypothetical protein [Cobetia sp. L2A1]|uniref:hypothetical protein n=1 Tax=Cobetia sp. L2A1 TaxID=2686360 RepID=UPI00131DFDDE|nr:hypothetical protein [Cobetia sp. L2A1]
MHDAIREAHELIGATLRDPRTQRQGKVVGMDLGREQPAIYVLWQESAAAERIAMEPDDFRALMEHLRTRLGVSQQQRHSDEGASTSREKQSREKTPVRSDSRRKVSSGDERHSAQQGSHSSTATDDIIPRSAQG